MKSFLLKHYQSLLIVLVTSIIFALNLTPGSYLAGWDSLQTELNPLLGVKRALFSVWQEYQSFGLTAGMAHAADLPRAILIFLVSPILPNWLVRYAFHILMLGIAGLGMLRLLRFSLDKHSPLPIAGALSYMLSYSTIQMMFLPFEPFSVFFASLPWLLWIYLRCATHPHKLHAKNWLLFTIINILALPSFVAQQLFVVYCLTLFLLTIGILISIIHKSSFINHKSPVKTPRVLTIFKRSLIAATLILVINSFWLFPQIYFLATNGDVVRESKINQIATEDIFYSNRDRGNLNDFLTHTGFFSDRLNAQDEFLFASWNTHRQNPIVLGMIALLITITLIGILQKSPFRVPFALLYGLCALALMSNTEPVASINELVRSNGFINQVFRSPFTKFSILHALVTAYFFTFGLVFILRLFRHAPRKSGVALTIIASILVISTALPALKGEYFSREMKVNIPSQYHEVISFFQSMPQDRRVALLPDYTFWGWFQTKWGYNGSGFLWYGIENPFVSRTFDVWSFPSESYYWELKAAVEAEDEERFESVLSKYDIDYLVFDKTLIPIVSDQKSLQYDTLETMLDESDSIKIAKEWENLIVYEVTSSTPSKDFVSLAQGVPNIGPLVRMTNDDTAYQKYGTYQTPSSPDQIGVQSGQINPNQAYEAYFPFLDLMTQTQNAAKNWNLATRASSYIFESPLPFSTRDYTASISSQSTFALYSSDTALQYNLPLETRILDNKVSVSFPAFRIDSFTPDKAKIDYCLRQAGDLEAMVNDKTISLRTADNATGCIEFEDPTLNQRYGYLVEVKNTNEEGPRFYFYILDGTKEQAYVEDRIARDNEFYILGPHFSQGLGYSFSLQNGSYRNSPSINTLEGVSVYLLPYNEIKELELINTQNPPSKAVFSEDFTVKKKNYYLYEIDIPAFPTHQTLILSQAYQPGWKLYQLQTSDFRLQTFLNKTFPYLFGEEVKDHVVINNWANGWNLDSSDLENQESKLIAIYLPQYLEYLGFVGLALTTFILLASNRSKK